ncbi:Uncharacterised protein [Klebsiella pneumoniae]|nr:Uncharacterised protein [Klebsiella pneumoniae]
MAWLPTSVEFSGSVYTGVAASSMPRSFFALRASSAFWRVISLSSRLEKRLGN